MKRLIKYPANQQTRKKYQHVKNEFMTWCDNKQVKAKGDKDYNRSKQVCNCINDYVNKHPDGKGSAVCVIIHTLSVIDIQK